MEWYVMQQMAVVVLAYNTYKFTHKVEEKISPRSYKPRGIFLHKKKDKNSTLTQGGKNNLYLFTAGFHRA